MSPVKKKLCGAETTGGTACKRLIDRAEDACFIHSGNGPPDGFGAPEGNNNAEGNDGGPPEGNTNAARHGAHMSLDRRLEYINEGGFLDLYLESLEVYRDQHDDPDDTHVRRLAVVDTVTCLVERELFEGGLVERELFEGGLFREVPLRTDDGDTVTDPETGDPYTESVLDPAVGAHLKLLRRWRRLRGQQTGDGG